jgi:hypothetical protein
MNTPVRRIRIVQSPETPTHNISAPEIPTIFNDDITSFDSTKMNKELSDFRSKMNDVLNTVTLKTNELINQHEEKYKM